MRAPIGLRISSRRRVIGLSQAALARQAGISASYLNLIESNKRQVGGSLLLRIGAVLGLPIDELTGESEHRLIHEIEEAFADPVLERSGLGSREAEQLVATEPEIARAIARLHRAYSGAAANADAYANRLRADPLLAQLLHQVLSGLTALRAGAEILTDIPDLSLEEEARFLASIRRESEMVTEVTRALIAQFELANAERRSLSPRRELDDLIFSRDNHFAALEEGAAALRGEIESFGRFSEAALVDALAARFAVTVERGAEGRRDANGFPGQYGYDAPTRTMWFTHATTLATRQFQLSRLYSELALPQLIDAELASPVLTSDASRRLARGALSSYFAAAMLFPYDEFLALAEARRYDIEALREHYAASFEQVAHRLVTLRRAGAAGVPFGFLRSDPAGRLTKHFPLPGLMLPNGGHACPLWPIYLAFRTPEQLVRRVVRFSDDTRYLFLARTVARRTSRAAEPMLPTSIMLACDVLHADRTVYGDGLALADRRADLPVGPSCRMCTRRDCASRQEDAFAPARDEVPVRAPLVGNAPL